VIEAAARQKYSKDFERHPEAQRILVSVTGQALTSVLAGMGGFSALAGAPSHEDARDRILGAFWPGSVAAEILLNILLLHVHGHGGSVRKAVFIVREYLATATTESGKSLGGGTRFIQESWSKYRPVVHLWAAHRVWFFDASDPEAAGSNMASPLCPFRIESLPAFLSLAMAFLAFGASHYPPGKQSPTLCPKDAWVVSPELERPEVTIHLGELESWKVDLLKTYKPEL
jgi:hypothetical protein